MGNLATYWKKRDFSETKEPRGKPGAAKSSKLVFVVQMHAATRLHYDFRVEVNGVMASWAVTRGPSLNPADKRLAVRTEDHPMEYNKFEGVIPEGNYGAGEVIIWDRGTWIPEGDPEKGLAKGRLRFELKGERLHGTWNLVLMRARSEKRENWLLIKSDDEEASTTKKLPGAVSVKSGVTLEELKKNKASKSVKKWVSNKDSSGKVKTSSSKKDKPEKKSAKKESVETEEKKVPYYVKIARGGESKKFSDAKVQTYLKPCLALYQEKAPLGEQWLHEVKFDGYRTFAVKQGDKVNFVTRSGLDWTARYGDALEKTLAGLKAKSAVLDGEIIVENETGASDFSSLQESLSEKKTSRLIFYAFDMLMLDGKDLRRKPLIERKEALEKLLLKAPKNLRYSPHFTTDGGLVLEQSCRLGLEGVISKKRDAPYRAGRAGDWIKTKCRQRQEFVIIGYSPSTAAQRQIRSLLLGYYEDDELKYAGNAGSGLTVKSNADLYKQLKKLERKTAPLPHKKSATERWVEPQLLVDIEFAGWTGTNMVRQGVIKGVREDKPASEVVRETRTRAKNDKAGKAKPVKKANGKTKPGGGTEESPYRLSHPERLLWPQAGVTKSGLMDYYEAVWPLMKPFIAGRPLSLVRCPDGAERACFFQKHAGPGMSAGLKPLRDPKDNEPLLVVDDLSGIATLVQFGTLEIHGWMSMAEKIEKPDMIVFDLDPDPTRGWDDVRTGAILIKDVLEGIGLKTFAKLSGGKGIHIVAPIIPQHDFDKVKAFCKNVAKQISLNEPKRYIDTASKAQRHGRIFIDYLRNGRGATAVLPYSSRKHSEATVAMPVAWDELSSLKSPAQFKIENALARVESVKDPWKNFFKSARALKL